MKTALRIATTVWPVVVAVLVAAGCGGGSAQQTPEAATASPGTPASGSGTGCETQAPEASKLNVGDTAQVGDARVTVNGFRFDTGGEFVKPLPGYVWVFVDLTICNVNQDERYILSTIARDRIRDATNRDYFVATSTHYLDGSIEPGDKISGEVPFEVAQGAQGLQFVYKEILGGTQQALWNLR